MTRKTEVEKESLEHDDSNRDDDSESISASRGADKTAAENKVHEEGNASAEAVSVHEDIDGPEETQKENPKGGGGFARWIGQFFLYAIAGFLLHQCTYGTVVFG